LKIAISKEEQNILQYQVTNIPVLVLLIPIAALGVSRTKGTCINVESIAESEPKCTVPCSNHDIKVIDACIIPWTMVIALITAIDFLWEKKYSEFSPKLDV